MFVSTVRASGVANGSSNVTSELTFPNPGLCLLADMSEDKLIRRDKILMLAVSSHR